MTDLPFRLPPLPGSQSGPVWTGRGFRIGSQRVGVLRYPVLPSGWTDELTGFHEAAAGEVHFIDVASRQNALDALRKWAGWGDSGRPVIVDVGCSSGFMIADLQRAFPRACVVGIDYVNGPLEALAKKNAAIPLIQCDIRQCPLPPESVDAVTVLNVLEHIDDDAEAIEQIYRILRPGGIVFAEVPAGPQLYDVYDQLLLHYRRYSMAHLAKLFAKFEVLKRSHLGFCLYPGFWLVKKHSQRRFARQSKGAAEVVKARIRATGSNHALRVLINLERLFGKLCSWPFGIRCFIAARKAHKITFV